MFKSNRKFILPSFFIISARAKKTFRLSDMAKKSPKTGHNAQKIGKNICKVTNFQTFFKKSQLFSKKYLTSEKKYSIIDEPTCEGGKRTSRDGHLIIEN